MERQYHEPETYSKEEVRAMQAACGRKIKEARKEAFLEAIGVIDGGIQYLSGLTSRDETKGRISSLKAMRRQIMLLAEEQ